MDNKEFKETLLAELNTHLRNQNVKCVILPINPRWEPEDTLYIGYNQKNTQVTYIDQLAKIVRQKSMSIPELAGMLIRSFYTQNNMPAQLNPEQIICQLINQKHHTQYLKNIPHIPFFDMAITFSQPMGTDDSTGIYMTINEQTLKNSNMTLTDIYWKAMENTFQRFPARLLTTSEYFRKYKVDPSKPDMKLESDINVMESMEAQRPDTFFVLLCEGHTYGGTALLNYALLQETADRLQRNLFILPYSYKGFAVIPQYEDESADSLIKMVRENPPTDTSDVLTEKILYYDRATQKITELKPI